MVQREIDQLRHLVAFPKYIHSKSDFINVSAVAKADGWSAATAAGNLHSSVTLTKETSSGIFLPDTMNFLTKKSLPRRTVLRGLGASLSLPLLDAMIPAATALAATPAKPVKRLGFVFMPMGADLSRWTPESKDGSTLDTLSPILQSLAPVRKQLTAFTNLELRPAYPGSHATSNSAFLSAARAKLTESTDYYLGTTVDQVAAKAIGQETMLPSLELAMDLMQLVGQCDNGYACVYHNNLSWSSPTTPLPAEAHPRLVFEKIFGEGGTSAERKASLERRSSLLDFVKEDMLQLKRELGPADRGKVDHYLDSVREVERRIQKAEAGFAENPEPDLERPIGVPASYADHARLMFDLQVLALRGDVTRVITFQLARETSNRTYPEIGVPDPHHPLSHHGNDPDKHRAHVQDQCLSRIVVLRISSETGRKPRRRKYTA